MQALRSLQSTTGDRCDTKVSNTIIVMCIACVYPFTPLPLDKLNNVACVFDCFIVFMLESYLSLVVSFCSLPLFSFFLSTFSTCHFGRNY